MEVYCAPRHIDHIASRLPVPGLIVPIIITPPTSTPVIELLFIAPSYPPASINPSSTSATLTRKRMEIGKERQLVKWGINEDKSK